MYTAGKKIRITKITDFFADRGDHHPNGIGLGYAHEGIAYADMVVGHPLEFHDYFHTSKVVKINNDNTFETKSGVYKLEFLD